MTQQDGIRRTYVTLLSLKNNLPERSDVHEKYIHEYHVILEKLEKLGFDVREFKISGNEVKPILAQYDGMTNKSVYSRDRYVERAFFLIKLDALLGYFSMTMDERKPLIGFNPTKEM